jgi:hypothetical protein
MHRRNTRLTAPKNSAQNVRHDGGKIRGATWSFRCQSLRQLQMLTLFGVQHYPPSGAANWERPAELTVPDARQPWAPIGRSKSHDDPQYVTDGSLCARSGRSDLNRPSLFTACYGGLRRRADTVPRPAMLASKGSRIHRQPRAPESTTSSARSGRLRRTAGWLSGEQRCTAEYRWLRLLLSRDRGEVR